MSPKNQGQAAPATTSPPFDLVLGNPPYVRQEELKAVTVRDSAGCDRPLKEQYECFTGTGGILSFITSNKYCPEILEFSLARTRVLPSIDFLRKESAPQRRAPAANPALPDFSGETGRKRVSRAGPPGSLKPCDSNKRDARND